MIDGIHQFIDTEPKLRDKYEIVYSTMSDYFKSVKSYAEANDIEWDIYDSDLWEYNNESKPNAFWTGYFSTYPDIKRNISTLSQYTESSLQLMALNSFKEQQVDQLLENQTEMLETLSILQHHDAITGTHTRKVGLDYQEMIDKARQNDETVTEFVSEIAL